MNGESAEQNEQNIATVRGQGVEVTFKQIAGLLARRIVFTPKVGDVLERGQRVGLIKFGSRVDVLLPAEATIRVTKGEKVKGGETVLATMPVSSADSGMKSSARSTDASLRSASREGSF